jgi:hypothetical protein
VSVTFDIDESGDNDKEAVVRIIVRVVLTLLLATPGHAEHSSGQSCDGAAASVLTRQFGENVPFTLESHLMLGVTQNDHGPADALEHVKGARIYTGIHFRTACQVGTGLGAAVADYALQNKFQRLN